MADPMFSRIEITLRDRVDLEKARKEILDLAAHLRVIERSDYNDDDALILARHKIKETSQKLRNAQ